MSFTTRNLNQTITIFSVSSVDVFGSPTYASSVSKGRWEDTQVKFVDDMGIEAISSAVVYLKEDVSIGDYIHNGSTTSNTLPVGAREVKGFSKTPDLRGKTYLRKALLK